MCARLDAFYKRHAPVESPTVRYVLHDTRRRISDGRFWDSERGEGRVSVSLEKRKSVRKPGRAELQFFRLPTFIDQSLATINNIVIRLTKH